MNTYSITFNNINETLLEKFKSFAKEIGKEPFIEPKKEINANAQSFDKQKPQTLEQALLELSELDLDLEDDFFRIPQEPMREFDWGE